MSVIFSKLVPSVAAALAAASNRTLMLEQQRRRRVEANKGPSGNAVALSYGAKVGGWEPRLGEPATVNYGLKRPCKCGSGKKYKRCCLLKDLYEIEAKSRPSMPAAVKTGRTLEMGGDCGLDEGRVSDGGDRERLEGLAAGGESVVRCGEDAVLQAADRIEARAPASDSNVPVEVLFGARNSD